MVRKPVVFISSTSDLRSARDLVGKVLYSMGYEPVWQDIEATDGGELLGILRKRVDPCDLVIQLVGRRYGAEPPTPSAEFGRVSYTQFEALYAERLGRKVVYYFVDDAFPTDPAEPESDDRRQLQDSYRRSIEAANKLRQTSVASAQDLELSIRRITDELAAVRTQSDRRFRRMLWLVGGAVGGIALVGALAVALLRRQARTDVEVVAQASQVRDELASMRQELLDSLMKRRLASGDSVPEPLSPALIEKAKILLARGNAEEQALARIGLKQHAEADSIIRELKSKPGNPIDEAFRLLAMESVNWYRAGQPDKAIEPIEQAMALRPRDIAVRQMATLAHAEARLGNIGAHQRRAIEIADGTLELATPGSADWANTQINLCLAWVNLPTGDRAENVGKAIAACEQALTVFTKAGAPNDWATAQQDLGNAWQAMPTGDRDANLRKAIAAHAAALTVRTRTGAPAEWAQIQNSLGNAWSQLPKGDWTANQRKAIAALEAALTVRTREAAPIDWARTQTNLGAAWARMPTGDRAENLRKAIAAFEAALTVQSKDATPIEWATTQHNLGATWLFMPTGAPGENLGHAIAAFEAALTVRTKDGTPVDWATTQGALGTAWGAMPTGDRAANLQKAIRAQEAALTIFTRAAAPIEWARTQIGLGNAWQAMPTGDRGENLLRAIAAYDSALAIVTKSSAPALWALAESNLGVAWSAMPAGDQVANLQKAIVAYEAALTVRTRDAAPTDWADTEINVGNAWSRMPVPDRTANRRKAIAAYQAALNVYDIDSYPAQSLALRANVSWNQVLTRDFQGVLATAEGASRSSRKNLYLESNLAHALLFLGRTEEAKAIYLGHVGEKVGDRMWQDVILQDLDDLEKEGLTHPQFQALRTLLTTAR